MVQTAIDVTGSERSHPSLARITIDAEFIVWHDDDLNDRGQAAKILEEAAEVFSAVEIDQDLQCEDSRNDVLDEIADVMESCMNMAFRLGFKRKDIEEAIVRMNWRNIKRGRVSNERKGD